ncbi:MAG: TolC family protein [Pseudomonadales bacterium]
MWLVLALHAPLAAAEPLTLERAVAAALAGDPGLRALAASEASEREMATADAALPDPMVGISAFNFPVDSFKFDQEPMTQYRISVRQELARGNSQALKREWREVRASRYDTLARERRADVTRQVSVGWLDLYAAARVVELLDESAPSFVELESVSEAQYAVGRGSQQDVVRAGLEQQRLQDRLLRARDAVAAARDRLARWIGGLARLPLSEHVSLTEVQPATSEEWQARLQKHPLIIAQDDTITERSVEREVFEQEYKPRFGVEVAYGLRDGENLDGSDRADFLTVGVTFDLPLFTATRQDRRVAAARLQTDAARDARLDALRQLKQRLDDALRAQSLQQQRVALFEAQIIPASEQSALAALAGYRSDASDFAEVVRAHIEWLDARIELERARAFELGAEAELRYLSIGEDPS